MLLTLSNLSRVSYSTFQDYNDPTSKPVDILQIEFKKAEGFFEDTPHKSIKKETCYVNITKDKIKNSNLISFVDDGSYLANCYLLFSVDQFEYIKSLILKRVEFFLSIETSNLSSKKLPITSFSIKIDGLDEVEEKYYDNLEKNIIETERHEALLMQLSEIIRQLKETDKTLEGVKGFVFILMIIAVILSWNKIF